MSHQNGRKGSITVDFAGSKSEVQDFIKKEGHRFPRGLSTGRGAGEATDNGCPVIYARFESFNERKAVQSAFEVLGWDAYCQGVRLY